MCSPQNIQIIKKIYKYPHLLGHLLGRKLLTNIHSQWIHYLWNSKEHRALEAHRGSYKTTAIAEIGIVWKLLFNPDIRIGLVRKNFTKASAVLKTVSSFFKTEEIKTLFYMMYGFEPKAIIDRDNKLVFNFKRTKTKEGNLNAYGVESDMTGDHLDHILLDDFVTMKDRLSRAEREKGKLVAQEIVTNIIDPGKPISVIGTPWHRDDAYYHEHRDFNILPKPIKFTINDLNILSKEEIEQKRKTITPSLFSINYLLKITASEKALFSDVKYDNWDYQCKKVVAHLDASYNGKDTSALTIFGEKRDGTMCAIGFTSSKNVKDWFSFILDKYKKYKVGTLYKETNDDKGYTADYLNDLGILTQSYHEKMNKHIKIVNYLYKYWDKIYWDYQTDDAYLAQIIDYEEGAEPDDCPDSAASLIREAFDESKFSDALYSW